MASKFRSSLFHTMEFETLICLFVDSITTLFTYRLMDHLSFDLDIFFNIEHI